MKRLPVYRYRVYCTCGNVIKFPRKADISSHQCTRCGSILRSSTKRVEMIENFGTRR